MKTYLDFISSPVHLILNAGGFKMALKAPFYFQVERTIFEGVQTFLIFNCPAPTQEDPQETELLFYYPVFNKVINKKQFVNLVLSQMIVDDWDFFSSYFNQECFDLKPTPISKMLALYLNLKKVDRSGLPSWIDPNSRLALSLAALNNPFFVTTFYNGLKKCDYLAIGLRDLNGNLLNSIYFDAFNFYSRSQVSSIWKLNNQIASFAVSYFVFNPFVLFQIYQRFQIENSQAFCVVNPDQKIIKSLPFVASKENLAVIFLNKSIDQLTACLNFLSAISFYCFNNYKLQFSFTPQVATLTFFVAEQNKDTFFIQTIMDLNLELAGEDNCFVPVEFQQFRMSAFNHLNNSFTLTFYPSSKLIATLLLKLQVLSFFPENLQIEFFE